MSNPERPPTVVERDGDEIVVDQAGYELILRTKSGKSNPKTYHEPDVDAARNGEKRIRCVAGRRTAHANDTTLIWRRRVQMRGAWSSCDACNSDDPNTVSNANAGRANALADRLDEMNVEEFDAVVNGGDA